MHEFYENLSKFLKQHPTLAIATVIETEGSTPRESHAKMIVFPDGGIYGTIGGGGLEQMVIDDALKEIENGNSFTKTYNLKGKDKGGIGSLCGGSASVHVEIIRPSGTILLCGGGHIAKDLASMAVILGMNIIVVDDREDYASKERFPGASKVIHGNPSDSSLKDLVTPSTYIVLVTHGHEHDKEALKNLILTDAAYIGMIGSKNKVTTVMNELRAEGVPAEALNKVFSPIGLDIGAETPAEIALSILSEIVHVIRKGTPSPSSMKTAPGKGVKKK